MDETKITIRRYGSSDVRSMRKIWNEVVSDGVAFPQEELLTDAGAATFFVQQSETRVAVDGAGHVLGLYILHPNNIGRCGHIANASFAVARDSRGLHIGEQLVQDCIRAAKALGFRILQFNAVVASNTHARHLYERIGFHPLGTIPGGFRMNDGEYADICLYYIKLDDAETAAPTDEPTAESAKE